MVEEATTLPLPSVANNPLIIFKIAKLVVVALVVEASVAWKELGKITWLGRERVQVLSADKSWAPAEEVIC